VLLTLNRIKLICLGTTTINPITLIIAAEEINKKFTWSLTKSQCFAVDQTLLSTISKNLTIRMENYFTLLLNLETKNSKNV
jgi:hypothetical protein